MLYKKISGGFFIVIEGLDGSGKSTLAKNLTLWLNSKSFNVTLTKEPGGSDIGVPLRAITQEHKGVLDFKAEFLLFAADRAQHYASIIKPALLKNNIVMSDRFKDSSLAFQGYGRRLDLDIILKVNSWVTESIIPDCTFYIDIDVATACKRIMGRAENLTRFEQETRDFWKRVHEGYSLMYKDSKNYKNLFVLNGQDTQAGLLVQAQKSLAPLLDVS